MRVHPRHLTLLLAVLALLAVAAPGVALARGGNGGGGADGLSCPSASDLYQPFLGFGDPASYFLAPGGSFESGPWAGGTTVKGNEPYYVRRGGQSDKRSLLVGASGATSPSTCIGLGSPTIRFFAVRTSGAPTSTLGVSVTYTGADGLSHTLDLLPVGATANGAWLVSAPIPILANATVLPQPAGVDPIAGLPTAGVRFTFTPAPGSSWQIDDVFVDPYQRN